MPYKLPGYFGCLLLAFGVVAQPVQAFVWPSSPKKLSLQPIVGFGDDIVGEVWVSTFVSEVQGPEDTIWWQCRSVLNDYQGGVSGAGLEACYEQVVAMSPAISSEADFTRLPIGVTIALPLTRVQAAAYAAAEPIETQYVLQSDWDEVLATMRQDMELLSARTDEELDGLKSQLQMLRGRIGVVEESMMAQTTVVTTPSVAEDSNSSNVPAITENTQGDQVLLLSSQPWWHMLWLVLFVLVGVILALLFRHQRKADDKTTSLQKNTKAMQDQQNELTLRQRAQEEDVKGLLTDSLYDITGTQITEEMINEQKLENEPLVLSILPAGHGAAIPKVEVWRRKDKKGQPYLEIVGAYPNENAVHPSIHHGEVWFRLSSLKTRLSRLIRDEKIVGRKKAKAMKAVA